MEDTEMRLQSEEPSESPLRPRAHTPTEEGREGQAKVTAGENERDTWPGVRPQGGEPDTATPGAAT